MKLKMHLYQPDTRDQSGFSIVEVLLVVLVVAVLTVTGFMVYQRYKSTSAANTAARHTTQTTTKEVHTDPYAGWKTYTNSTYSISYKYPPNWAPSGDVVVNATTRNVSATKQESSTGLKLTTDRKYNDTVVVEVLDENLATAEAYYDSYYPPSSPVNKVTKNSEVLKGKQTVIYDEVDSGNDSKLYLFSVGSKTYTFGSINEKLNVQYAPDYWTTFQRVFDSLTLQ